MENTFQPFAHAGWFNCSTCSVDLHKNLAYNTTLSNNILSNYFCSESCYNIYYKKQNPKPKDLKDIKAKSID